MQTYIFLGSAYTTSIHAAFRLCHVLQYMSNIIHLVAIVMWRMIIHVKNNRQMLNCTAKKIQHAAILVKLLVKYAVHVINRVMVPF